jgi:hypothetical protein
MKRQMICLFLGALMFASSAAGCKREPVGSSEDLSAESTDSSYEETSSDGNLNSEEESMSEIGSTNSVESNTAASTASSVSNANSSAASAAVVSVTDPNDKPASGLNTATLIKPLSGKSDAAAAAMRKTILAAKDNVPAGGQKWYISNKGDNANDGTSPEKAWATIVALDAYKSKIKAGDAVLFERGGVYRGTITTISGVFYGAYGSGDKPCLYGSKGNFAKAKWTVSKGNVWVLETIFSSETGIIAFNHGEAVAIKKMRSMSEVTRNYDYYFQSGRVYLYMDKGNPADIFKSIEIGELTSIIRVPENVNNVTIENFTLKYAGLMAIECGDNNNILIRGCEVGWIGGSVQNGERLGNGIQFWANCNNVTVENCWLYQIYDTALTPQCSWSCMQQNITFKNNLIEYCVLSVEYWIANDPEGKTEAHLKNLFIKDNIMRFAGYGWGEQRPAQNSVGSLNKGIETHLQTHGGTFSENVVISGNVFDMATGYLVNPGSVVPLPTFSGNTYIQTSGGLLATMNNGALKPKFDANVLDSVRSLLKDATGTVQSY